jgi:competence protein ComEC
VSEFSGSTLVVPAFGVEALALMAFALVTATLLVSRLRMAAIVPALAGIALAASPKRYDIYIDREGSGAAIRGESGRLVVVGRVPGFVVEQWLKADGDARKPDDPELRAGARCDPLGCVVERAGARPVALVSDRRAFAEDCRRADLVISPLMAPPTCAPALLLDRRFLTEHGAAAVRFTAAAPDIVTTRRPGEARPWRHQARPSRATARPPPSAPDASSPPDDEAVETP